MATECLKHTWIHSPSKSWIICWFTFSSWFSFFESRLGQHFTLFLSYNTRSKVLSKTVAGTRIIRKLSVYSREVKAKTYFAFLIITVRLSRLPESDCRAEEYYYLSMISKQSTKSMYISHLMQRKNPAVPQTLPQNPPFFTSLINTFSSLFNPLFSWLDHCPPLFAAFNSFAYPVNSCTALFIAHAEQHLSLLASARAALSFWRWACVVGRWRCAER